MNDIVKRLREYARADHERGCQGRCYSCECGYDAKRDPLMTEAAAEIERLRVALRNIVAGNGGECGCIETARHALEQQARKE